MKNQTATSGRTGQWFRHLNPRQADRDLDLRRRAQNGERARIARDLHDTLFQGFLGARMKLQVLLEQLPIDAPGKPEISRIIDQMERAIDDGRDAVRGLRTFTGPSPSLEQALARVRDEVAPGHSAVLRMFVKGNPRLLKENVCAETYAIGREALINAFRHSEAKSIEVEIEYSSGRFRLTARDNGRGIDPRMIKSTPEGRWGLVGMRERAEGIGAKIRVWSRPGAGTEVEVSVPAEIAFEHDTLDFLPAGRRLART